VDSDHQADETELVTLVGQVHRRDGHDRDHDEVDCAEDD
jgi:hypothetical protein